MTEDALTTATGPQTYKLQRLSSALADQAIPVELFNLNKNAPGDLMDARVVFVLFHRFLTYRLNTSSPHAFLGYRDNSLEGFYQKIDRQHPERPMLRALLKVTGFVVTPFNKILSSGTYRDPEKINKEEAAHLPQMREQAFVLGLTDEIKKQTAARDKKLAVYEAFKKEDYDPKTLPDPASYELSPLAETLALFECACDALGITLSAEENTPQPTPNSPRQTAISLLASLKQLGRSKHADGRPSNKAAFAHLFHQIENGFVTCNGTDTPPLKLLISQFDALRLLGALHKLSSSKASPDSLPKTLRLNAKTFLKRTKTDRVVPALTGPIQELTPWSALPSYAEQNAQLKSPASDYFLSTQHETRKDPTGLAHWHALRTHPNLLHDTLMYRPEGRKVQAPLYRKRMDELNADLKKASSDQERALIESEKRRLLEPFEKAFLYRGDISYQAWHAQKERLLREYARRLSDLS